MALSLTYLGLVVLCNSMFVSNYLLIRILRLSSDTTTLLHSEAESRDSLPRESGDSAPTHSSKTLSSAKEAGFAFCFGYLRKARLEERSFPNWKPIPYKLGATSTTVLIIMFSILFSEKVLNKTFGLDPAGTNPAGSVCTPDDIDEKIDGITERLIDNTNFHVASRQMYVTNKFLEALQNDTNLYGEDKFHCVNNPPFTKADFLNDAQFGKSKGQHFFPGMCTAAQEYALSAARTQTCSKEFCNTGEVVDQSSITAANGQITGLDDLGILGIDEAKNAIQNKNLNQKKLIFAKKTHIHALQLKLNHNRLNILQ